MKIVLLGYMASGKSTIGKNLAKKLYLPFIDLDNYIEEKEKMPIKIIFNRKGEIYFRKIEFIYLKEILEKKKKFVLSLGGGTPCYIGSLELINKKDIISVYLQASIKTLKERLTKEKNKRPLIAHLDDNNLTEYIAKHLFERNFFYKKATYTVKIDTKIISKVVTEIRGLLH